MNTLTRILWTATVLAAAEVVECRGAEAGQVRTTIERSLKFLGKEGDAWMAEQNCVACHHMALLIWSHGEAQRRGFQVNQIQVDEWTDWSLLRLDKPKAGVEPLAELIFALPAAGPQLRQRLQAEQQKDGAWKPGGQFATMQRRATPEAQEATTRLSLLALLAADGDKVNRDKAVASLGPVTSVDSTETLVWRALLDKGKGVNPAMDELLKRQNPDGGWAWHTGQAVSDALATGEVLYALHEFPNTRDQAIRARNWLVSHQSADGSWVTDAKLISKLERKDFKRVNGIYHFWGTAWATIGLLQDMPVPAVAER